MIKKRSILNALFTLMFMVSVDAWAFDRIQDQMIQELDVLKYHLAVKYAPGEIKKERFGWNLEEAHHLAKMRILNENPATSKEYHKIINQFLGSTRDYHVGMRYFSTAFSFFPFKVKKVNDRYFFAGIQSQECLGGEAQQFFNIKDTDLLTISESLAGIMIGNEIIEMDGRPIKEVIEELIDENFNGDRSPTGYELVVRNLFLRRASLGQDTPRGFFNITLKDLDTDTLIKRTFPWLYLEEMIPDHPLKDRTTSIGKTSHSHSNRPFDILEDLLAKDFSVAVAKDLKIENVLKLTKNLPQRKFKDEREKGFLPALGEILWETSKTDEIYAYIYRHPVTENRIGYIYLPSFSKEGEVAESYMSEMMDIISIFNKHVDALVFDITDNTGGNMMFMYALLSILTDTPLKVPCHRELLIQEDIQKVATIYYSLSQASDHAQHMQEYTFSGYPSTAQLVKKIINYAKSVLQTWEAGEVFTDPIHIYGIDFVEPHPKIRLQNKPIMILTNALTLSCGDYFPAILQDNNQSINVVIFGENTGGAGGYVKTHKHTSRFGLRSYGLTSSVGYRLDAITLVEGVGVEPDFLCLITERDIRQNYVDYRKNVNDEIRKLIDRSENN